MFENYIGKKYGKLTITSYFGQKKSGTPIFCVTCECGNTYLKVGLDMLESGKTKDCGCSKRNIDLIGKKFGRLLVVEKTNKRINRSVVWKCLCDCGNYFFASSKCLNDNNVKSCGCIRKEREHFAIDSKLYKLWTSIITRCTNPNHEYYYLYGGRGIKICDEWSCKNGNIKAFYNFYNWAVSNGYKEEILDNGKNKYTIDRIDTNGDYSPKNCRFITNEEQQMNKRADKLFTYNNETKTIKQWLKQYCVKCNDYYRLLFLGLDNKQILDFISNPTQIKINNSLYWNNHKQRYHYSEDRKKIIDNYTNLPFNPIQPQ